MEDARQAETTYATRRFPVSVPTVYVLETSLSYLAQLDGYHFPHEARSSEGTRTAMAHPLPPESLPGTTARYQPFAGICVAGPTGPAPTARSARRRATQWEASSREAAAIRLEEAATLGDTLGGDGRPDPTSARGPVSRHSRNMKEKKKENRQEKRAEGRGYILSSGSLCHAFSVSRVVAPDFMVHGTRVTNVLVCRLLIV